jgi:cell division initiation protein
MRITPLDIRKQPFRKTLMGFDPDEVSSFLNMVAGEFESLIRAHDELSTQVKSLQVRLEHYEKIEQTLNETLITAQRATDEAKLNAQKEAELIIKDAQIRSDRYEDQARERVNKLDAELQSLKAQRDSFLVRFQSMLRDQLALLGVIRGDIDATEQEDEVAIDEVEETMDEVPPQPDLSSLDNTRRP